MTQGGATAAHAVEAAAAAAAQSAAREAEVAEATAEYVRSEHAPMEEEERPTVATGADVSLSDEDVGDDNTPPLSALEMAAAEEDL